MIQKLSKSVKKFWASLALLSIEMIIVLGLFVIALILFVYVSRGIFFLNNTTFDQRAFSWAQGFVSDRNNGIIQFFTDLGNHKILIPANLILIAYFLFLKKHRWYSISIPAIALTSLGLMTLLKHIFNRARPDTPLLFEAKGLSFPSGHALMSITFYGLLIYIVYKSLKNKFLKWVLISLLILLILIIGFTRIYLNVHYASDVIAGYCIGFLWLVFAVWLLNRMEKYSRNKLNKIVEQQPIVEEKQQEI